jgi:hypothetical protein
MSMHLVAMPSPVSCCLLQRVKFHTERLLLSGWLLTNVQVNITTTLHDTWHTCIYITSALLFILLYTHLPFFLAGWLIPTHRVGHRNNTSSLVALPFRKTWNKNYISLIFFIINISANLLCHPLHVLSTIIPVDI